MTEANNAKVVIYTTPTCVYCKMAKTFLTEKQIAYEEKNVLTDLAARADMVKKSGQLGVPVIEVDGQVMVGFDRDHLAELVGAK